MKHKLSIEDKKRYISLRRAFKKPVIGVTGNLGKTSTIEMLKILLESRGRVLKNHHGYGNWKNNIHTLEKMNDDYDYAIFEFDYRRGNNFAEILRLIRPTIGILTNIGDAHLNYLGGILRVALEKSAVVKYLAQDGVAILNKDDEMSSALTEYISTKNIIRFGMSQTADYFAGDIKLYGPEGMKFKLNNQYDVQLPLYSIQDVYNFLAAAATARYLNFSIEEIIEIFQNKFELPAGKGKLHKIGDYYLLDESYIGTPRSISKAARTLTGFKNYSGKLYFIVGDIMDAGVNVEDQHLNMGYFLSALPIDYLITVGEYARSIAKGASLIQRGKSKIYSVNTIDEVLNILTQQLNDKAVISVKGVGSVAALRILKLLKNRTEI